MNYALVTTTFDDETAARQMVHNVLHARLAACAQRYGVQSQYWWEGKEQEAHEIAVHFKTPAACVEALKAYIAAHHPYKVPQILVYAIADGHEPYLAWLDAETQESVTP